MKKEHQSHTSNILHIYMTSQSLKADFTFSMRNKGLPVLSHIVTVKLSGIYLGLPLLYTSIHCA